MRNYFAKYAAWCKENNIEQQPTLDTLLVVADYALGMTNQEIIKVFGMAGFDRLKTLDKPQADYNPTPADNEESTEDFQNQHNDVCRMTTL